MADKPQPARPTIRNQPGQARALNRINEYLRVAEELYGERGFDAVTMLDIGKKAGISATYIYRYFPDKFAVLAAIQYQYIELKTRLIREVVATISSREDAFEAPARFFDAYHSAVCEIPSAVRILTTIKAAKTLSEAEIDGAHFHAQILFDATSTYVSDASKEAYKSTLLLIVTMIDATVRLASASPTESYKHVANLKSLVRNQLSFHFDGKWPTWPAFYKPETECPSSS